MSASTGAPADFGDIVVRVASRRDARRLISISEGEGMPCRERWGRRPALVLCFDDVHDATRSPCPPRADHVERIVAFARDLPAGARLLVHCHRGISRSSAAAIVAVCARDPGLSLDAARQRLHEASPQIVPNRLLLQLYTARGAWPRSDDGAPPGCPGGPDSFAPAPSAIQPSRAGGPDGAPMEPTIFTTDAQYTAICDHLSKAGWTACWEPGQQDEGDRCLRFERGPLRLYWEAMAVSGHQCLEVQIHGVAGHITAVDVIETPPSEVPGKVEDFARACIGDLHAHVARALQHLTATSDWDQAVLVLHEETERQMARGYNADHDDDHGDGDIAGLAAAVAAGRADIAHPIGRDTVEHILAKWPRYEDRARIAGALMLAELRRLARAGRLDAAGRAG